MRQTAWALVILGVVAGAAQADERKGAPAVAGAEAPVAVVPFTGLHGDEPQSVVMGMLKRRARLVPAADVGKIAATLVVSGSVERAESGLQLVVTTLNNKSGDVLGQLAYPIKGRHLSRDQLKQIAKDVFGLVVDGLKAALVKTEEPEPASEAEADAAAEEAAQAVKQSEDTETAPLNITSPTQELHVAVKRAYGEPRPVWAPYVDANIGAVISSRTVSFSPNDPHPFSASNGGGIRLDLTVYPLAMFHDKFKGVFAGLGGGVTFDKPFWTSTYPSYIPGHYPTSENRVEGGARWRFVLRRVIPRIEVTALLGAGLHNFSIDRTVDSTGRKVDVGPPEVAYVFGSFGAQARVHFREWGSAWAAFTYEYVPDAGKVENLDEFGLASVYGLHVRGGADFMVWRRLKIGVGGFYERFQLSFSGPNPAPPEKSASRSIDQYYGGVATVGYLF